MLGCQAGNLDSMPQERINFEGFFPYKSIFTTKFLKDQIFFTILIISFFTLVDNVNAVDP